MFWKRDSWKGFPQTAMISTEARSMPVSFNRLLAASTRRPLATSSPAFMAKLT